MGITLAEVMLARASGKWKVYASTCWERHIRTLRK